MVAKDAQKYCRALIGNCGGMCETFGFGSNKWVQILGLSLST